MGTEARAVSVERSEWSAAKINDLPDSSFAYIEPGGRKDDQGKTVPRSLRHLPYKDEGGAVDLDHLRAALSRVSQTDLPKATQARVRARLEAAAAERGVGEHEKGAVEKYITHEGGKWQVRAESGKILGTHDSKGDAVRQLAAVEANKDPKGKSVAFSSAKFKAENPGSEVQTLIFGKDKYPKASEAKAWASDHGFESGDVEETGESFRLLQRAPDKYARMRTIEMTEGVQAVIGFPKKSLEAVKSLFLRSVESLLPALKAADLYRAEFEPVEETEAGTVYRVKCAGRDFHFAEKNGSAAPVPSYAALKLLRKRAFVPVVKSEEKRYTLGVCYPASKVGKPEPDFHGDVMGEDELEKSAWGFMAKGADRIGLMHRPGTAGAGRVVESYIYRGPSYKVKDVSGAEQEISPGDWMLGVVWNDEGWQAIKSGNLTGYSLQGAARKEAVA
jgi:hypothetical protein